jgi:hypothetical protein
MKRVAPYLLFLFFFTLVCDQLYIEVGPFRLKLSHLTGVAVFLLFAAHYKEWLLPKRYTLPALGLFFSILISALGSVCVVKSATYSLVWVFTFVVYFLFPFNLMHWFEPRLLIRLFLAAYCTLGLYALSQVLFSFMGIQLPFSVQTLIYVRGSAFAQEPSFYALYAIPLVTFLNARTLLQSTSLKEKGVMIASNLFLLASTSTTAILGYLLFPIILLCIHPRLGKKGFTLLALPFSMLLVLYPFLAGFFKASFFKFVTIGLDIDSFEVRWAGILHAIEVFFTFPFLGSGLGSAGSYLYGQIYSPAYSGQLEGIDPLVLEHFDPTNVFTEILACLGIVGMICILSLLFPLFKAAFRSLDKPPIVCLLVALLVMLVTLQVNQGLFRSYIWVVLGLASGYLCRPHVQEPVCACYSQ